MLLSYGFNDNGTNNRGHLQLVAEDFALYFYLLDGMFRLFLVTEGNQMISCIIYPLYFV